MPNPTPQNWDPEALYIKAVRYVQQTEGVDSDTWEYALWSSLALEFLARSALANVNPVLLADTTAGKSWSSIYHALGFTPTEEKFTPKSISISEVFARLSAIFPSLLTKEQKDNATVLITRRNAELHTGTPAFDDIKNSGWQPQYYQICQILLTTLGMELEEFVGEDEAKIATQLIAAAADENSKAVKGDIDAHKKVWESKGKDEQSTLLSQALIWSRRHLGHRVSCPACNAKALVSGNPASIPTQKLDDGEITETQEFLPNHFECIACGLKISGLSRLIVAGLGDRYKKTQTYDAADFYAPDDSYDGYEEDNNEP